MTLHNPREFQKRAIASGLGRIERKESCLYIAPTGTGKGTIQSHILNEKPRGIVLAQSDEILEGFRRNLGDIPGLWTVKKFFNRLCSGDINPKTFDYVLFDEGHHSDPTHRGVKEYLGEKSWLGFTATGYRGTPKETEALLQFWNGNVETIITIRDAVDQGYMSLPRFEVLPLVNDELISVVNGEFETTSIDSAYSDKLEDLCDWTVKKFWKGGKWLRPIMLTLSSINLVNKAVDFFTHLGADAVAVVGETKGRQYKFEDVVNRKSILVQIKVVGEGVDLPIRVLIDAAPTMSPVFWMQRVGRVTRPVGRLRCPGCYGNREHGPECQVCHDTNEVQEMPPEVYVTNHNLLRHGYLFEGLLPARYFKQAKEAWGPGFKPTRRMVGRAIGLDGLGKFAANDIPVLGGGFVWMFVLSSPDGKQHYSAYINPTGQTQPMYFVRRFEKDDQGYKRYDLKPKWESCSKIPDLTGYTSVPAPALTDRMSLWWKSEAERHGLDPEAPINSRQFQALPILVDTKKKLRSQA